jgi:hypothetical protein
VRNVNGGIHVANHTLERRPTQARLGIGSSRDLSLVLGGLSAAGRQQCHTAKCSLGQQTHFPTGQNADGLVPTGLGDCTQDRFQNMAYAPIRRLGGISQPRLISTDRSSSEQRKTLVQ